MKNNNEKFEKFIRDFDTIRMTQGESNKIRKNLEAFTNSYVTVKSPYQIYASIFQKTLTFALISVLAISSTKPASAGSLPGEMLYPIKIIHEKLEAATITKTEKKITFEIKRAETRIQEAVKLADSKKLDPLKQKRLADDIKKNVAEVSDNIKKIQKTDPEKALSLNSDLKTTLKVNSKVLKDATKKNKVVVEEKTQKKEVEVTSEKINIEEVKQVEIPLVEVKTIKLPEQTKKTVSETIVVTETQIELTNEDESFANIILDSLDEDIEKMELENNNIELEITETNDVKSDVELIIPQTTKVIEEIGKELKNETTTETLEKNKIVEVEIITTPSIPEKPVSTITEIQLVVASTEIEVDPTEVVPIPLQTDDANQVFEKIKVDIASMESVLLAQEKLRNLYTELMIVRNIENAPKIKLLIENEQFGQAYVQLQREIETLSEVKLTREVEIKMESTKKTQE